MDSQPPPPSDNNNPDRQPTPPKPDPSTSATTDATMSDSTAAKPAADEAPKEPEEAPLPDDILNASAEDIMARTRLIDNDLKVMRSETMRLNHERSKMREQIKDNTDKIKNNKMLPYLVGNVVEVCPPFGSGSGKRPLTATVTTQILDIDPDEDEAGEGANVDLDAQRKGKCAVIKTSTRQTIFLPLVGLVDPATLRPKDLIGVNKDSYLVLDTLPAEYDSRVKAMEVDEKPTESYNDIGGLDKQIEELVEAIVMPMQQAERFKTLGIKAPKGCLMYGPPGERSIGRQSILLCVHSGLTEILSARSQEPERPCWLVHVRLRPTLATSNSLRRHWFRCAGGSPQKRPTLLRVEADPV